MTFKYSPTDDGFRIHDTVENAWTDVDVGTPIDPRPATTDAFSAPLDDAVTIDARELAFSQNLTIIVRDPAGDIAAHASIGDGADLPAGDWELDTTLTSFKLYLQVEDAALSIVDEPDGTRITFDTATAVTFGVRSNHERPAGIVTAAQDPRALMRAISTFGSAMKTFSPERSFPTLRGHPPEVAVRGQTNIPVEFAPPDTGITVEVPPTYEAVFTATPLAYYLGATIEPGLDPQLVADGTVHEFDADTLSTDVAALLRHCFLLDSTVRTVGLYPTDLDVGRILDDRVTIDRETLYDSPIDERTARYLDIPLDATSDLMTWHSVADVEPVPLNAESLPYLAYRMTAIRSPTEGTTRHGGCCDETDAAGTSQASGCSGSTDPDGSDTADGAASDSGASDSGASDSGASDSGASDSGASDSDADDPVPSSPLRSFLPGEPDTWNSVTFVDPAPFDSNHHIWVGDGLPVRGTKPTLGSYLRSLDATPHEDRIDVHVVSTTDRSDRDAAAIRDQYSTQGIDVTIHDDPTCSELKDVLHTDHDFLHYRGAVSEHGFDCLDGTLDVRTLPRTGVSAFFLDGDCSFQQGLALVRVGAIGGVVTTATTGTDETYGRTLAALLDAGFPLYAAVDVLRACHDDPPLSVVGDGDHQLSQPTTPPGVYIANPDAATDDTIQPTHRTYPTKGHGLGTIVGHTGTASDLSYLLGDNPLTYTRDGFDSLADRAEVPHIADGTLHWPEQHTPDELWTLHR